VVLGRLGTSLAGGKLTLKPELSEQAVRSGVAEPFGIEIHEAAEAIVKVANANMANAVRLISISRGYDPRDFALVAFGGAGALHGAAVAQELSIPVVIVPPNPGVTSALGCLLVDIQHDFSDSFMADAATTRPADIEAAFEKLEKEAVERLLHEGVGMADITLQRTVEMMYEGQWRSLAISAPSPVADIAVLMESFHREHQREFNFRRDDAPISLFRVALKAIGLVPKARLIEHELSTRKPDPRSRRPVWFDGEAHDTPIFERDDLPAGFKLQGPAVVEQFDSTVVIPPRTSAVVDTFLNILIHVKEA
jgi:N-methylhydantoinase A